MAIKTKLLIFALSISLIPISIITTMYYFNARSTIKRQTLDWLTAVAESRKVHTISVLDGKRGRVVDFSSDGFIRDSIEIISLRGILSYAVSDLNRHLKVNKKSLDSHITSIAVLDINGMVVASTTEKWVGKDMSGENIFVSCVSKNYGETYTGKSYNVPYLDESCIFISAPLTSKQENKTMGVIINAYDIAILDEITTKRAGMGESGEALLGMRNGDSVVFLTTLKYAPDMPLSKSVPLDSSGAEPMRLALKGLEGAIIAPDYRNIDVVAAYQYISDMNWGLVTKIDKEEVFVPIARIRIFTIILGSINAIVVITIAIFLSKMITNPIQKLVGGTRRIAKGDLAYQIETKARDEIGELATSFNEMTFQLGESRKELQDYALNLERKVEDKSKEIKKSRDEWVNTFDAITDIITIHDKDFRIIRANKAFYEKFNDGIVQPSDKKCYEIFHGTDESWPDCPLERSTKSLQPEIEEVDDPHMGGVFLVSTYPLLDKQGELYGVVHQAKDITKMKKVEKEIIKEKEYTEDLIETAHDAIVCVDEKGTINVWNKSAEKIFGYSKSEMIGKSISTIIPVKIFDRFLQMSKIITISRVIEVSGKTKNGIVFPIETSISSREIEKGRYTFTIIMRDITFQKKAKKQLIEKANELRKVNKEIESFVYLISHDLKEPLFSIGGYTSRLSRVYEDTFDEKGKRYINRIKVNIKKMSQKIQEIMEVLKVGRVTYDFKNNDTGVIVNDVVKMLENKMEKNKINILIQDNLPAVLCDERKMKDVLSNLLANAIKFMGEGEQRQVRVGCNKNGDYYKFYIEDTGIGIREEYQEQIFKIFRRLNDIETEGTGVGLAIVKKIVEQHEGKIWVESPVTDGRGTRVCFTIPI